jgi:hypothetical protein
VTIEDVDDEQEMTLHLDGPMPFDSSGSNDESSDDDHDGDSDMDVDDSEYVARERDNDEEEDISIEGSSVGDGYNFLSEEDCIRIPDLEESETSMAHNLSASPSSMHGSMMAKSQVRTVSISEEA